MDKELQIKLFQEYVTEYMSKMPQVFELVFEEFDEEYSLEALYKDEKAVFRINTNVWKDDPVKYHAKMAVLLFIDEYFKLTKSREVPERFMRAYQAITFLID